MEKEEKQFNVLLQILKQFHSAGILQDMMLIGSWCLYFYRREYEGVTALPAIRTLDVDFLIPHHRHLRKDADIPSLLKEMGFVSTFNRSSGLVVYDHEDLRVEFLIPELGRGHQKPQEVKALGVKALALRYLNLLTEHPRIVIYQGLHIKVPEPAVFALHKLIISARRVNKEKARRDLEMAVGVLEFLYKKPGEIKRIKSILRAIPRKWLQTLLSVSDKHFPQLNETAGDF